MKKSNKKKNIALKEQLLINDKTPFSIKESFNLLRTNIIYSSTNTDGAPVYGVTSTVASSGKSTIMANLAIQLGNMSKKVLLIDADMRCPMQSKIFGYSKELSGLSEFLSGIERFKEGSIVKAGIDDLYIMPSGRIPPNPTELLMSTRFRDLIEELKREFDYILIDFPPIGLVADSAAAINYIDGYIFVARANQSKIRDMRATIDRLEALGGKIIGIVLNDVESKSRSYGRYGKDYNYRNYYSARQDNE